MGAGFGPACAFLYAGPAVNILALVLTGAVLGPQMGIARAIGAIVFAVVIGLLMQFIFRKDDQQRINAAAMPDVEVSRPLGRMPCISVVWLVSWFLPTGAAPVKVPDSGPQFLRQSGI